MHILLNDNIVMSNYIPLDIFAVEAYGVRKWQKEFFWPISHKDFLKQESEIKHVLNALIEKV